MGDAWMKDERLSGIDPAKLALLKSLAQEGSTKNQSDLLPFLMAASQKGTRFSPSEMEAVLEVLKTGKNPQQIAKMERLMNLLKLMRQK